MARVEVVAVTRRVALATAADVLVIGAGVMGMLVARELRARGRHVLVLERDRPGRQASWASAGIVSARGGDSRDPTTALDNLSADLYPPLVAALQDETGIDVEYSQNGFLFPAFDADEATALQREARTARASGIDATFIQGKDVQAAEPGLGPAVVAARLTPVGQIDNLRLLRSLELALSRSGVVIETGAHVVEVTHSDDRITGLRTLGGDYSAPVVVNAAGSWSGRIPGILPVLPVVPQRGQILSLWRREAKLTRVINTPGDPYLVPRIDGRVVVGATREFVGYDASLTAEGVGWLLTSAIRILPGLAGAPIEEMWTGFRPYSQDGRPFIGPGYYEGLYFATGHGPHGISPAPGTARLLASQIAGERPAFPLDYFSPRRVRPSSARAREATT